ncbi:MAG TPA: glutamyl-tRNA reductase [Gemmatimonadaceae bacterium]|nr:glutamyl-tRNA reductase [Gemmatimonadaceae bacterium]
MALIAAGVSHHTAPLPLRERLVVSAGDTQAAAQRILEASGAREVVLLSTCNRTEVYAVEGDDDAAPAIWSEFSAMLGEDVSPFGYVRRDRDAVAHLFRVTSGIDSMILGEAQIHGQVRDAWERSRAVSGTVLNRLFQSALMVGGRVRSETEIGHGAASTSSAAVQLASKIFGTLNGRHAMVLGAGEMAELALECLVSEGVRTAIVANRTHERAEALAERYHAEALHYNECWPRLADVDLLICSTAAPRTIVGVEQIAGSLKERGDRPLCILDIAVPRDVDPAVGALSNVFLYDLDDLRTVANANIERRREELPAAEDVIAPEVEKYWEWLAGLAAVPVLRTFRTEMDRLREAELSDAMRKLDHLSPRDREAIEHFSRALMNKFLHEPSVRLRAAAANGRGLGVVDALRYLFDLRGTDVASTEPESDTSATRGR